MESSLLYIEVVGVIVCWLIIALFSASEAVLTATNRLRLRHLLDSETTEADQRAAVREVLRDSKYILMVLVVGLYAPLLVCASLMTHIVYQLYPHNTAAVVGVSAVAVVTLLVFADVIPKAYAVRHAERLARWCARPARWLLRTLRPLVSWEVGGSGRRGRAFGSPTAPAPQEVTEDELKSLVEWGEEAGVLEAEETEIMENIFDLGETTVREIMVPRPDITSLPAGCTVEEALMTFERSGFSRIPLYEETIDNIVGILYAKDLLEALCADQIPVRPRDLAREPLLVPEMKKTDELFREMRDRKVHLAIVIDEYGGTAGLVSIEDILEELVGEILDEHDVGEEKPVQRLADGSAIVSARLDIDDLEDEFDLHLPEGEFDTVSGFCLSQLGHMPNVGDTVETAEAIFTVYQMRGRRVAKIKITSKGQQRGEDETGT